MSGWFRRSLIGMAAGGVASLALIPTVGHAGLAIVIGITVGVAYSFSGSSTKDSYVDGLMTGGSLGVPLWAVISVILFPLISSQMPEWSAEQMRQHFPALVGWVLYGATLGLLTQLLSQFVERAFGTEVAHDPLFNIPKKRILILGGGFAGMKTAECLEEELRENPDISISLVSETNALLFTPMLAEVAGSSLEPSHISTPLRSSLHRTNFIRGRVSSVDLDGKRVVLEPAMGDVSQREVPYDHLVFSLGAVSNYLGLANVQKYAIDFKSLVDAIKIRNRVIEMFERADRESDAAAREALLTFVIAGGGFAGVELAGALNDFARGILADYPNLDCNDVRVVLVHSRDRILPELSESLGRYAQKKMEARGVEFRMNTRLMDAQPGKVALSGGELAAETLVWTDGTAPNPLFNSIPIEKDKRGAVIVDSTLAVKCNNLQRSRWHVVHSFGSKAPRTARKWHGWSQARNPAGRQAGTVRCGHKKHASIRSSLTRKNYDRFR